MTNTSTTALGLDLPPSTISKSWPATKQIQADHVVVELPEHRMLHKYTLPVGFPWDGSIEIRGWAMA